MKQGTYLTAKLPFTMRKEGTRGRAMQVSIGDVFMVTTAQNNGDALIARKESATIGQGYRLTLEQISHLFDVEVY